MERIDYSDDEQENLGAEDKDLNLTSAEGLKLPEGIKGDLDLQKITSAEDLVLPEGLKDIEIDVPENVGGGDKDLNLTSAEGLVLPTYLGGEDKDLNLTSAEGLKLPEDIEERIKKIEERM